MYLLNFSDPFTKSSIPFTKLPQVHHFDKTARIKSTQFWHKRHPIWQCKLQTFETSLEVGAGIALLKQVMMACSWWRSWRLRRGHHALQSTCNTIKVCSMLTVMGWWLLSIPSACCQVAGMAGEWPQVSESWSFLSELLPCCTGVFEVLLSEFLGAVTRISWSHDQQPITVVCLGAILITAHLQRVRSKIGLRWAHSSDYGLTHSGQINH